MSKLPLFEFDSNPQAVLQPNHEHLNLKLPAKFIYGFVGSSSLSKFLSAFPHRKLGEFICISKTTPIYAFTYQGQEIGICEASLGAPAATQIMDWLIAYGAQTIIATGSCGALVDLPENTLLIPERALRDEGTSYHYLPAQTTVTLNRKLTELLAQVSTAHGYQAQVCQTWTTDGFYRETRTKVKHRIAAGYQVVEMECAALAACAAFRHVDFAQLLFTADSLYSSTHDARGWGKDSHQVVLKICLHTLMTL